MPLNLNIFDPDHRFGATALARSRDPARQAQGIAILGGIDKRAQLRQESETKAEQAKRAVFAKILVEGMKTRFEGAADPQSAFEKVVEGAAGQPLDLPPLASLVEQPDRVADLFDKLKTAGVPIDPESAVDVALSGDTSRVRVKEEKKERDLRTVGGALLEVPEEGAPTVLFQSQGRERAPSRSALAKAEVELKDLRNELEEAKQAGAPNAIVEEIQGRLSRAEAFVQKTSGVAKGAEAKSRFDTARASISVAEQILAGGDTFGSVAGIPGALKATFGGLARQFGIQISSNSKSLQKSLEIVQATIGPPLLKDTRLSDTERARLATLVGSLDGLTDEQDIRSNLAEMKSLLDSLDGRPEGSGAVLDERDRAELNQLRQEQSGNQ